MRIDSHQHFWQYNQVEYDWMSENMEILKRDHLPSDLDPLLQQIGFEGTITVQARKLLKETEWLLALSDKYDMIKGVRHVIQDEPDDNFVLGSEFQNGIAQLKSFNLTYDLLIFPRQLPSSIKLVEKFPEQPFVLDHLAKPDIKNQVVSGWAKDMCTLARCKNVYCKLSGMVTEADKFI